MPRAGLDKNAVVKAAAEIANTEGIEALTLSHLAEKLGIQTPSLYNHIKGGLPSLYRELSLLSNRMLGDRMGEAAIGKSRGEAVMDIAQAYRQFIKECPGLYMASVRVPREEAFADPDLAAAEERVVKIAAVVVMGFGIEGDDVYHAVRALRSVVHGFATLEVAGGFGMPLDCDESFRRLVLALIRGLETATS